MLIDLSMFIDEDTPIYPGSPEPEIKQVATVAKDGWNATRLSFDTHFGTHIDAPYHMLEDGKKLDEFPVDKFVGEAVVIELSSPDLDLVKEDDIVFFYTGQTEKKELFKDYPVISKELAQALVDKKVKIVGLDSFTTDDEPFDIHKMFFRNEILIVENLVKLKELVGKRFECFIMPLKIRDVDGAPCRVIARV